VNKKKGERGKTCPFSGEVCGREGKEKKTVRDCPDFSREGLRGITQTRGAEKRGEKREKGQLGVISPKFLQYLAQGGGKKKEIQHAGQS